MNPMIRAFFIVMCAVAALAAETAIHRAVREGDVASLRARLAAGGDPNERDASGRTPLIEAAELGQIEATRVLISAGADLNARPRGWGSALEMAERTGHAKLAEMLRQAGARTFGRSVGDKVCVRPWKGDGYCGMVEAIDKHAYTVRVTEIVGCKDGCPARGECSAGKPVGGAEGLRAGDAITTVSWCLTHTGVQR
jgi:ankyrin repeat protein